MKLLNLGCGINRIEGEHWTNVDMLRTVLSEGTPERTQLDQTPNYIEHDLTQPLPFDDKSFSGILLSHVIEHFNAQAGLALLSECWRVLERHGSVLVSVPDAGYFRRVYPEDRNANWPRLFEVSDPPNPIPTFFQAALWFNEHKAILTHDSLWCYLRMAGFDPVSLSDLQEDLTEPQKHMRDQLNRRKFSCEMVGVKP